ncbi:tetratricopeptide repeat protein [Mastigocoleus testarum]|uniref:DUF7779 domain-containing protein n=1 Tax=Mastigocoleus testarum BC008 TaxID=371196 RepID=A0A0V7ZX49_9CYAN|nr:tetratricopeptide repeat protein [Mastigocoleus testarum]KST69168.1 hypothetical protein BC008_02990 [Mastigocoleus testarum BC008]KST69188.1 hypothetical protein BC008_03090 [Mastigocoleus testarum BC008]
MLQRLQEQKLAAEALQDRKTLNSTQLGVQAAFALTWEKLEPLTQQLGKFLSLFSPQSILWNLVVWVAIEDDKEQEEKQLTWSEQELNEARKQLYERNLLQLLEETSGYYKIHSLVRWFLQAQLAKSSKKLVLERRFAIAMISITKNILQSPTSEDIKLLEITNPYLEELGRSLIAEIAEQINYPRSVLEEKVVLKEEVIWVFVGVGKFYEEQGLYELAEPWYKQCLRVCKVLFEGDHPDVATSLNNLAFLYSSQERYTKAKPLYQQALQMRKRLFQGDHPDVATSLSDLALLYSSQGRYTEAKPLYQQALQMRKHLFQGDHLDVATSLNNLALLYSKQGRYLQAEPLYQQALKMCERVLGVNHPTTVTVRKNLTALQVQQTPIGILRRWLGNFVGILLLIAILPFYLLWLFAKGIFTFTLRQLRR